MGETTGGRERFLLDTAHRTDCSAHRADTRIKALVQSLRTLGKTDAIDARALALYGQKRHARPPRWQAPTPGRDRLQVVVFSRRDFVAQRLAFVNRLGAHAEAFLTPLLASFGGQPAAALFATMPELGSTYRRQGAAPAGFPPNPDKSGTRGAH